MLRNPDWELVKAVRELREEETLVRVRHLLDQQYSPLSIVEDCRLGLTQVGEAYSRGEYFLGDLVMSAEIFEQVMAMLKPFLTKQPEGRSPGRIVFGTVEGDIHDIGKNITVSLLRCEGYQVVDLGVNVPPDQFVEEAVERGAEIIALSALLTSAFEAMRRTVRLLQLAGLRPSAKILVGGLVNQRVCQYVRADAWARDARDGVEICRRWLKPPAAIAQR